MHGLTRWLATPFATELAGERLVLAPLRLCDFAALEIEAAVERTRDNRDLPTLGPAEMACWLSSASGIVATLRLAARRTMPRLAPQETCLLARRATVAELTRVLALLDRATGLVLGNVLGAPGPRGSTTRGAVRPGRACFAT